MSVYICYHVNQGAFILVWWSLCECILYIQTLIPSLTLNILHFRNDKISLPTFVLSHVLNIEEILSILIAQVHPDSMPKQIPVMCDKGIIPWGCLHLPEDHHQNNHLFKPILWILNFTGWKASTFFAFFK